jgi:xanthine dehydrogenase accessory factor
VSLQSEFGALARDGERGALVTVVRSERDDLPVGGKLLVRADGATEGSLGDADLDAAGVRHGEELMWAERSELRDEDGATLFVDIVAPPPRLMIFGAVDFAAELCRVARAAGYIPYVIDPRGQFATSQRFPEAEEIIVAWPKAAFTKLGGIDRATSIAVLTHDPKLDDAALTIALDSDAPYIGAMGSRRAQAKRRERLLALGITDEQMARIRAPIGLDLGGLTAGETALSIMGEVVAVRNGRTGGPLSLAGGRIHDVS